MKTIFRILLFATLILPVSSCEEDERAKPTLATPLDFKASKGEFEATIQLEWQPTLNATNYELYKSDSPTGTYTKIGHATEAKFEDNAIGQPLTQFFYKVKAVNSATVFSDFSESDYGYASGKPEYAIRSFGQQGTADDQFGFNPFISIDENDMLYVSDTDQYAIKRFAVSGEFKGLFKSGVASRAPVFIENKTCTSKESGILVIEEDGKDPIQVDTDMAIVGQMTGSADGYIYFAVNFSSMYGFDHHRIYKYDLAGNAITSWGSRGNGEGQLDEPWGVFLYKDNVVVTCQKNLRAQFFSTAGQFIRSIDFSNIATVLHGNYIKDDYLYIAAGSFIIKSDLEGKIVEKIGEGLLTYATSVVVDSQNNIIVSDAYGRKISVFRKKG